MIYVQGTPDRFMGSRLCSSDIHHRKSTVRSYLEILTTKYFSNPLNGGVQLGLIEVLKPIDREVIFTLS